MYGPVRVEGGAGIDADGTFASVTFFKDEVGNAGDISANNQGTVLFEGSVVFNQDGGVIEAATLSTVTFDKCHGHQSGRRDDRGERRPGAVRSLDDHQR
jgi:hypothetical protein